MEDGSLTPHFLTAGYSPSPQAAQSLQGPLPPVGSL